MGSEVPLPCYRFMILILIVPRELTPGSLSPPATALCQGVVWAPQGRAEPGGRGLGEGLQTPGPWDAGPQAESAAEMTVKVKSFYLFQERTRKMDLDILYENRQTEKRTK